MEPADSDVVDDLAFVDDLADADAVEEAEEAVGEPAPAPPALTERERQILAFEHKWWRHAGAKEQAIRDTFEVSSTRYYQVLNALLDNPAALEHAPVLVGRLRRLRTARARARGTGQARGTGRVA